MLFRPAPANVALIAIQRDSAPTGRRKIHQRTPLSASDNKFTTAARSRTVRLASVMLCQVLAQLTLRANSTSAAMIATVSTSRKIRETAFFTRRRVDRSDNLRQANDRRLQAPPVPSALDRREDRSRRRHA